MPQRPLKILIVDHAPIFGGVEATNADLVQAVDPTQFELTIATDLNAQTDFGGARLIRLSLPPIRRNPFNLLSAGLRLAGVARHFDLMMTTTARTHPIGAIAASLSKTPLIWRLADDTFPLDLARPFTSVPKCIVANSAFTAGRSSPAPAKTKIIYNGLRDRFQPDSPSIRVRVRQSLGLNESDCVAIHVARLVRWKGHLVFAQAVKASPNMIGLIVGGEDNSSGPLGGRGLRADLESFGDQLKILGHRTDIADLLTASDIFVHASTLPEPFGRTIVEAMLAGVAVCATRAGGAPEIVGTAGRLIACGDVAALASALQMDADTRKRLGQEGRERALKHFELSRMVRQYEEVWRECIA